jgi:hypothetical protein
MQKFFLTDILFVNMLTLGIIFMLWLFIILLNKFLTFMFGLILEQAGSFYERKKNELPLAICQLLGICLSRFASNPF